MAGLAFRTFYVNDEFLYSLHLVVLFCQGKYFTVLFLRHLYEILSNLEKSLMIGSHIIILFVLEGRMYCLLKVQSPVLL